MSETKKMRIALWMYPEEISLLDKYVSESAHPSRNQFISTAVNFYVGFLRSTNENQYLPIAIESSVRGIVDMSEDRIARLIFKLSVEMCMMMHILASTCDIDENTLNGLRGKCIEDIKRSIGTVDLKEVVRYQNKGK